jgi:hypothetical protein
MQKPKTDHKKKIRHFKAKAIPSKKEIKKKIGLTSDTPDNAGLLKKIHSKKKKLDFKTMTIRPEKSKYCSEMQYIRETNHDQ